MPVKKAICSAVVFALGAPLAHAEEDALRPPPGIKLLELPNLEEINRLPLKKAKQVRPNELAVERKKQELRELGQEGEYVAPAHAPENEIELADKVSTASDESDTQVKANDFRVEAAAARVLPKVVDNSKLKSFPPIGNQGGEGNCYAWSSVYYMSSHQTCLVRGCDNKASADYRFSPRWPLNIMYGGANRPAHPIEPLAILEKNGALNLKQVPYVEQDVRSWHLNPEHWKAAISNRMNPMFWLGIIKSSDDLNTYKQYLANGNVFVALTSAYGFRSRKIKNGPYAGEMAITHVVNAPGGHGVTIVGYDDNIWIDVNNNNTVDAGEKGALKLANSWGTGWGNGGYMWIAYDALNKVSKVPGAPSAGRQSFFWNTSTIAVTAKKSYQPKLLAEVTLNHARRHQITIDFGVSSTSQTTPQTVVKQTHERGAFSWRPGQPIAFDGGTNAVDGTFYLDMTDLMPDTATPQNYYLLFKDRTSGYPLTIKSFKLIDTATNQAYSSRTRLPLALDNQAGQVYATYSPTADANTAPVARMTTASRITTSGTVITFNGTGSSDSDGSINKYEWNFGDGSAVSTNSIVNHLYTKAGTYQVTLTVTDDKGAKGRITNPVQASAPLPSPPPPPPPPRPAPAPKPAPAPAPAPKPAPAPAPAPAPTPVPGVDRIAPSAPTGLVARWIEGTGSVPGHIRLTWNGASDNVGVKAYVIYRNGEYRATTVSKYFNDYRATDRGVTYTYQVVARDAVKNISGKSNTVVVNR